jgi:hypothetical protein
MSVKQSDRRWRERAQQYGGYYQDLVFSCDDSDLRKIRPHVEGIMHSVEVYSQPIGQLLTTPMQGRPGAEDSRAPNAWGLYDVLGRWKWFYPDFMRDYRNQQGDRW